jgi:hypothetical protein
MIINNNTPMPIRSHAVRGKRRRSQSSPAPKKAIMGRPIHRKHAAGIKSSWSVQWSLEDFAIINGGFMFTPSLYA